MRRADRRDDNEPELVAYVRRFGAYWIDGGPFDGLILWRGEFLCVEIKRPDKEGHADEYTPLQRRLMTEIHQRGGTVHTLRTKDDVDHMLGARRVA